MEGVAKMHYLPMLQIYEGMCVRVLTIGIPLLITCSQSRHSS